MEYVVNFFATPIIDYGKLFREQSMKPSANAEQGKYFKSRKKS